MRLLIIGLVILSAFWAPEILHLSCEAQPLAREPNQEPNIARARAAYPEAKRRFLAGLPQGYELWLWARLPQSGGRTEVVLITVDEIVDGQVVGHWPESVARQFVGPDIPYVYTVSEEEIIDWAILGPDGTVDGNFRSILPEPEKSPNGYDLIFFAELGNPEDVRELLDAGVDPDLREFGDAQATPLLAVGLKLQKFKEIDPPGYVEIVRALLEHKADPNARYFNATALGYATSRGHRLIAQLLLAAGADPDAPHLDGRWTPLMLASREGHIEVVKLLLQASSRLELRSAEGKTACDMARDHRHPDILALLTSAGGCNANEQ